MFPSPSACPPKVRITFGSYQKCSHVHYTIPAVDSRDNVQHHPPPPSKGGAGFGETSWDCSGVRNINCASAIGMGRFISNHFHCTVMVFSTIRFASLIDSLARVSRWERKNQNNPTSSSSFASRGCFLPIKFYSRFFSFPWGKAEKRMFATA